MNTEEESGTDRNQEEELIQDSLDYTLLNAQTDYLAEIPTGTPAYGSVMSRNDLERLLHELLPNENVRDFGIEWILNRPGATEESVREAYQFLKSKDIKNGRIATYSQLMGINPETLQARYENLQELEINDTQITKNPQLLGRNPETIKNNRERLQKLGLSNAKIASRAQLLDVNPGNNTNTLRKTPATRTKRHANSYLCFASCDESGNH